MALKVDPFSFPDPAVSPRGEGRRTIVLGGGCFWCTEAVYLQLEGVLAVRPGYAGDREELATYDAVSSGRTNHAEVIEVAYDAAKIGLGAILKVFFSVAHDPTQKDRQGADVGRQYRSVIFYADDEQRRTAEAYVAQLEEAHVFDAPIATEIAPLEAFYQAEEVHHDFAARNPRQPYIRAVSDPKVAKLRAAYASLLKQP